MARLPRLYAPGCAQHIIQRGNNRQACFFDEADYAVYLDKLKEASEKYGVAIHAFVLMTNHVHLLATPEEEHSVSRTMQALGRYFVRYINTTYERSGTLWEGRYRSTLVGGEDYVLTVSRYIELNPVRANMVDHASEYPWSSYRANALGKPMALLQAHPVYRRLGKTDAERQGAYRALFRGRMAEATLEEIRASTNKGWALGSGRFKKQVDKVANRRATSQGRGGDRKSEAYLKNQLL